MNITKQAINSHNYTITMSEDEAAKLRRACHFNITISDRVSARDGGDAGSAMYGFLSTLGEGLKAQGVKRWKRS